MSTARDLLLQRLRRDNPGFARLRAAPLPQIRAALLRWRARFSPTDVRAAELDALQRALPDCLSEVGREAAEVLAARAALAQQVGVSAAELLDLVARRSDCDKSAALAGQIARAAALARQDLAALLAAHNQRALDALCAAYRDPATSEAERSLIGARLAQLNEVAAPRPLKPRQVPAAGRAARAPAAVAAARPQTKALRGRP